MAGLGLLFFGVTAGERRNLLPRTVVVRLIAIGAVLLVAHLIAWMYDISPTGSLNGSFSESVLGVEGPRVGLLSVGEEQGKGTEAVAAAHRILGQAGGIDFAGNVEGDALPAGAADVVVTDGFTGNVALKLMEGTAKVVTAAIRDAARSNPLAGAGGLLMRPALGGLRRELHPDTTGGAILLGLRHVAVVGHGGSGAEWIANAVRLAARCVSVDAVERTAALLRSSGATRRDLAEDSDAADPVQA